MHKDDFMTPKERKRAMKEDKNIDRVPIYIMLSSVPSHIAGFTYKEGFSNEKNIAKSLIETYRRFGHDSVSLAYGLHGIGRALGSELNSPEDTVASIEKHVLNNLDDIHKLDFDKTQLSKDHNLKIRYRALEMVNEEIGEEVSLSYGITGPFTSAASVYPPERLLKALRKEPEKVQQLLEFITECLLGIIESFAPMENVSVSMADPVASGSILSPKLYKEFVLPYTKRLVDAIHRHKKSTTYHICGDTTNILELMAESNSDNISLDNKVDLSKAKEVLGPKVQFVGNVDPVNYLLLGDKESIDNAVKECFKKAYGAEKGFYISTGCDLPLNTPIENIAFYMDSCRKYTKYPIDTTLFWDGENE